MSDLYFSALRSLPPFRFHEGYTLSTYDDGGGAPEFLIDQLGRCVAVDSAVDLDVRRRVFSLSFQ